MAVVTDVTLTRWGNSQGLRIPREVCDLLGIGVGSRATVSADASSGVVTLAFERPGRRYARSRRVSIEELCAGWDGDRVGEEWGGPDVGGEVVP